MHRDAEEYSWESERNRKDRLPVKRKRGSALDVKWLGDLNASISRVDAQELDFEILVHPSFSDRL